LALPGAEPIQLRPQARPCMGRARAALVVHGPARPARRIAQATPGALAHLSAMAPAHPPPHFIHGGMAGGVWEGPVKISIAATNPCHLFPLAIELARADALGCYYSGYPAWKLDAPPGLPVRTHSFRTTLVYAALKFLPSPLRPNPRLL